MSGNSKRLVRAGNGGIVPPEAHRFKPGQSGNPAGRKTAGASVREWMNVLAEKGSTELQLRRVARDKKAPWAKRTAAEVMLKTLEAGDLADMEDWLNGEKSLGELRQSGINTEIVKKAKVRRIPTSEGEIIEREVELHDRAGESLDRVMDRTEGKPTQELRVDNTQNYEGETMVIITRAEPRRVGCREFPTTYPKIEKSAG